MVSLVINTGCSCNPCSAASFSAFSHVHTSIPTTFLPILVFLLRISLQGLAWLDCYGCSFGRRAGVLKEIFCSIPGGLCICESFHMPKLALINDQHWNKPQLLPLWQNPKTRKLQDSHTVSLVLYGHRWRYDPSEQDGFCLQAGVGRVFWTWSWKCQLAKVIICQKKKSMWGAYHCAEKLQCRPYEHSFASQWVSLPTSQSSLKAIEIPLP